MRSSRHREDEDEGLGRLGFLRGGFASGEGMGQLATGVHRPPAANVYCPSLSDISYNAIVRLSAASCRTTSFLSKQFYPCNLQNCNTENLISKSKMQETCKA